MLSDVLLRSLMPAGSVIGPHCDIIAVANRLGALRGGEAEAGGG